MSSIPSDVITLEIFPFLSSWEDVGRVSRVCKEWRQCAEPEKVNRVKAFCFGLKDWKKYYGCDVEKTPLPQNLWNILTSPCPFWSKKTSTRNPYTHTHSKNRQREASDLKYAASTNPKTETRACHEV